MPGPRAVALPPLNATLTGVCTMLSQVRAYCRLFQSMGASGLRACAAGWMAAVMSPCQTGLVVSGRCQPVTGGAGALAARLTALQGPIGSIGIEPQFIVVLLAPGPACAVPLGASARADATGTAISPSSVIPPLMPPNALPNRLAVKVISPAIASTGIEAGSGAKSASSLEPAIIALAAGVLRSISRVLQSGNQEQTVSPTGPRD